MHLSVGGLRIQLIATVLIPENEVARIDFEDLEGDAQVIELEFVHPRDRAGPSLDIVGGENYLKVEFVNWWQPVGSISDLMELGVKATGEPIYGIFFASRIGNTNKVTVQLMVGDKK